MKPVQSFMSIEGFKYGKLLQTFLEVYNIAG